MRSKRFRINDVRVIQAQIMHRVAAGMNSAADLAIELGINLTAINKHLRSIEERGDIKRIKYQGVPALDLQFVTDNSGLMKQFPLTGYSSGHQVMPGGRVVELLDRPSNWNPVPLRKSPRASPSGAHAWLEASL
ncbi:MAG TPA: hypothetical protein VK974_04810 [Methylophilaceae bacterium]|nr:hypothetical protein [Methylophilaceae bacterium]